MNKLQLILVFAIISSNSLAQSVQLPYFNDFEAGASGWLAENKGHSGTIWELGEPLTGHVDAAYSGDNCWELNLNSYYTESSVCHLISPVFDFTFASEAEISFYTKFKTEYLWDYLTIQYTVDSGNSWTFLPFPFLENPNGQVARWIQSSVIVSDLMGFSEVQFRFTFTSDATINFDGYAIDDFRITTEPLGVASASSEDFLFDFYPNPSNGLLHVNFTNNNKEEGIIQIYDNAGKLVLLHDVNHLSSITLDLSVLANGVYSIVYNRPTGKLSKKLVVMK